MLAFAAWYTFNQYARKRGLYDPDAPDVDDELAAMAAEAVDGERKKGGAIYRHPEGETDSSGGESPGDDGGGVGPGRALGLGPAEVELAVIDGKPAQVANI